MSEPGKWGMRVGTYLGILLAIPFIFKVNRWLEFGLSPKECVGLGIAGILFITVISILDGVFED